MSGWFAMKRGIHEHPIFHKRPDRLFVWSWMLATAAWKDTQQDASGTTVTVKRGQLLTSYRQMSDATGVGVQVIRTLIGRLTTDNAIDTFTNTGRLLVTIRNYDKYQYGQGATNTLSNTELTQSQHTKEQGNNSDYVGQAETGPADDPTKVMFDSGRQLLAEAGKSPDAAGKLLGRWRRDYGTSAVIEAIGRCRREGALEPVGFIEGVLRFQAKRTQATKPGYVNAGAFGNIREVC